MSPRLTNEEFLARARQVHGEKFDYSRVEYIDAFAPMEIKCVQCDRWFSTSYQGHVLRKRGCSKCTGRISRNGNRPMTTEQFVARAIEVHGQKYSYEQTECMGSKSKVTICCPKHSYFTQAAGDHLSGYGCQKCGAEARKSVRRAEAEKNAADFFENAISIHGIQKYDYSQAEYKSWWSDVKIRCIKCDLWFTQRAGHHLSGHGCEKCKNIKDTKGFIEDAIKVHGPTRFDYREVKYKSAETRIKIYCNKCERFFSQSPTKHLRGRGCPTCKESKGERAIAVWLKAQHIEFEPQWTPPGLVYGRRLMYDFFADGKLIEFDGKQHFYPVNHFGGMDALIANQERDSLKNKWAAENGFSLKRISYKQYRQIDRILSDLFFGEVNNEQTALALAN